NAISPGFIETESYAEWDPAEKARWRSQIPLGRFGRPEEVAEAVSFLASEKAAYISGTVLHVHGGLWI
ncbi:MAG TPA: SDR family oxidoreductase, partial [Candidatus Polarisedimenticolia bacterium]